MGRSELGEEDVSDADDITETEILVDVTLRTVTISLARPLPNDVFEGTIIRLNGKTLQVHAVSPDRREIRVVPWVSE